MRRVLGRKGASTGLVLRARAYALTIRVKAELIFGKLDERLDRRS